MALNESLPHAIQNPSCSDRGPSDANSENTCFEAACSINKRIEERAGGPTSDVMSLSDNWIHAPYDNALQLSYFRTGRGFLTPCSDKIWRLLRRRRTSFNKSFIKRLLYNGSLSEVTRFESRSAEGK
jgi:hypothetical protein